MQTRHALLNQEDIRRPSGARAAEERDGFAQHAASGLGVVSIAAGVVMKKRGE